MNIPIENIKELIEAALHIKNSQDKIISVNLLIDDTVDLDFQAFVRSGFNCESPNARVMISYFPSQQPDVNVSSDIGIIIANSSPMVGDFVESFQQQSIPCAIICENKLTVLEIANENHYSLSDDDIITIPNFKQDETVKQIFADSIGQWIVDHIPDDKRLAFSNAFSFVRHPLANLAIRKTAVQNAGFGVLVFIPGADMPVMTLNQAKMVLQIAAVYGESLDADRIKELVGVVAGGFLFRGISRQLCSVVPILGWAIKGGIGYVGTVTMGRAALDYFEGGGNAAGVVSIIKDVWSELIKAIKSVQKNPLQSIKENGLQTTAFTMGQKVVEGIVPVVQSAASQTSENLGGIILSKFKRKSK